MLKHVVDLKASATGFVNIELQDLRDLIDVGNVAPEALVVREDTPLSQGRAVLMLLDSNTWGN